MKKLIAIVLAAFAMSTFAAEPAAPVEKPKQEMKLAKKKKDKDAEAKTAKAANKSPKKTEATKK